MKKIKISVAVLLCSAAVKAQNYTEYIDISSKKLFGRSEMVVYNDDTNYNDLEYLYLGPFNKNFHFVKYTNVKKIIISLQDDLGDTRKICTQQDTFKVHCQVYDSFAQQYKINVSTKEFKIWISKPLK